MLRTVVNRELADKMMMPVCILMKSRWLIHNESYILLWGGLWYSLDGHWCEMEVVICTLGSIFLKQTPEFAPHVYSV